MHLTYSLTGLPQKEIGAVFGVGRFAVSKATAMIGRHLEHDRRLRQLVNHLRTALRGGPL